MCAVKVLLLRCLFRVAALPVGVLVPVGQRTTHLAAAQSRLGTSQPLSHDPSQLQVEPQVATTTHPRQCSQAQAFAERSSLDRYIPSHQQLLVGVQVPSLASTVRPSESSSSALSSRLRVGAAHQHAGLGGSLPLARASPVEVSGAGVESSTSGTSNLKGSRTPPAIASAPSVLRSSRSSRGSLKRLEGTGIGSGGT